MKIESVETFVLKAPVPGISTWKAASFATAFRHAETTLVKITTDDGLYGWGEVHAPVAPEVTKTLIDVLLAPAVTGRDPLDGAAIWDAMYRLMRPRGHALGFMPEAMSGIDIAILDVAGKALGVPTHTLLGGAQRTSVRTYASVLQWIDPEDLPSVAEHHRDRGFTAMKVKIGQDRRADRRRIEAARAAVGDDFDLMADANCRYSAAEALTITEILADQAFVWLEEPVPPEDLAGYRTLGQKARVAIAGGECECTHYRFAQLLSLGAFDVIQPDICRAGGLTACHRIGVLADAHNVRVAPHVSIGSAIHIAASLQWAASEPSVWIHELPVFENPLVDDLLVEPLQWADGYLQVPSGPGIGVDIRSDVLEKYRTA